MKTQIFEGKMGGRESDIKKDGRTSWLSATNVVKKILNLYIIQCVLEYNENSLTGFFVSVFHNIILKCKIPIFFYLKT